MTDHDNRSSTLPAIKSSLLASLVAASRSSQATIAARAGISAAHLSRIVHGQIRPTDETFQRIMTATGVPATVVAIAAIIGPENLPIITRSIFLQRLAEELPTRMVQDLGPDIHDADPRWAQTIVDFVVRKTLENVERKRQVATNFDLIL